MSYFADLHVHSRYARATSKDLRISTLDEWALKKGIRLLGTGDFTHPFWFGELKKELAPAPEAGLYIRSGSEDEQSTRFVLSVEIATIYNQNGANRRLHTLILLPSFEAAEVFNKELSYRGKLASDGRPILGMSTKELGQIAFSASDKALVIPAHAWTPWFGVFGSMSGFDSLEECFEELTPRILAIETGLSSDPPMNWRLSVLDSVALASFSDAHSARKLGRELTEIEGELSYDALYESIRTGAPNLAGERDEAPARIVRTLEFFPEEGKYHFDGHRNCKVRWTPEQRKRHDGKCSVCGRPVTVGVLSRVDELATRDEGFRPDGAPEYTSLIPLEEIIAEAIGQSVGTKKVNEYYETLVGAFDNELAVLIKISTDEISARANPVIGEAVKRVRDSKVKIEAGYDGEFGTISLGDLPSTDQSPDQTSLF